MKQLEPETGQGSGGFLLSDLLEDAPLADPRQVPPHLSLRVVKGQKQCWVEY